MARRFRGSPADGTFLVETSVVVLEKQSMKSLCLRMSGFLVMKSLIPVLFLLSQLNFSGCSGASRSDSHRRLSGNRPLLSFNTKLKILFNKYKERHVRATSSPESGARYIVTYEFDNGALGNSYPGIISAFFLALLTNRTLLLEDGNALSHLEHDDIDFRYSEQVRLETSYARSLVLPFEATLKNMQ